MLLIFFDFRGAWMRGASGCKECVMVDLIRTPNQIIWLPFEQPRCLEWWVPGVVGAVYIDWMPGLAPSCRQKHHPKHHMRRAFAGIQKLYR